MGKLHDDRLQDLRAKKRTSGKKGTTGPEITPEEQQKRKAALKKNGTNGKHALAPQQLTGRVVELDLALAIELLEGNTLNRTIVDRVVERYAKDMLAGNWLLNGEPIIRTADLQLLDGQHRCWGVVKAAETRPDIKVLTFLVEGADASVMPTIDTGRNRMFSNVLQINGYKNSNVLAAAARMVFWHENLMSKWAYESTSTTHSELEEVVETNPDLPERVDEVCRKSGLKKLGAVSTFAFLYYRASTLNAQKAGEWLGLLSSGAGMEENHPVLKYRERLLDLRENKKRKVQQTEIMALGIKSWNLFVTGKRVQRLTWAPDKEEFPVFRAGLGRDA